MNALHYTLIGAGATVAALAVGAGLAVPYIHKHLEADYNRFSTHFEGEVGLSFRIGQLLRIALLLLPILRWYLQWQKEKEAAKNKEQVTNV